MLPAKLYYLKEMGIDVWVDKNKPAMTEQLQQVAAVEEGDAHAEFELLRDPRGVTRAQIKLGRARRGKQAVRAAHGFDL